eukprot:318391_1
MGSGDSTVSKRIEEAHEFLKEKVGLSVAERHKDDQKAFYTCYIGKLLDVGAKRWIKECRDMATDGTDLSEILKRIESPRIGAKTKLEALAAAQDADDAAKAEGIPEAETRTLIEKSLEAFATFLHGRTTAIEEPTTPAVEKPWRDAMMLIFYDTAKREVSVENLAFLIEVEEMMKIKDVIERPGIDSVKKAKLNEELQKVMVSIYKHYVEEINVSAAARKRWKQAAGATRDGEPVLEKNWFKKEDESLNDPFAEKGIWQQLNKEAIQIMNKNILVRLDDAALTHFIDTYHDIPELNLMSLQCELEAFYGKPPLQRLARKVKHDLLQLKEASWKEEYERDLAATDDTRNENAKKALDAVKKQVKDIKEYFKDKVMKTRLNEICAYPGTYHILPQCGEFAKGHWIKLGWISGKRREKPWNLLDPAKWNDKWNKELQTAIKSEDAIKTERFAVWREQAITTLASEMRHSVISLNKARWRQEYANKLKETVEERTERVEKANGNVLEAVASIKNLLKGTVQEMRLKEICEEPVKYNVLAACVEFMDGHWTDDGTEKTWEVLKGIDETKWKPKFRESIQRTKNKLADDKSRELNRLKLKDKYMGISFAHNDYENHYDQYGKEFTELQAPNQWQAKAEKEIWDYSLESDNRNRYHPLIIGEYNDDVSGSGSLLIGGIVGASTVVIIMLVFCLGVACGMVIYWGYAQKSELEVKRKKEEMRNWIDDDEDRNEV